MDEVVLKWITRMIAVLTLAVCILLGNFPDIMQWMAQQQKQRQLAAQRQAEQEAAEEAALTAQVEALMERAALGSAGSGEEETQEDLITGVIQREEEGMQAHLQIELPKEVKSTQVKVENDYLDQKIRITFPTEIKDYFSSCQVRGDSKGISSMTYHNRGKQGVLELNLSRVYEIEKDFSHGKLFMNLVNPHDLYEKIVVIDAGHGGDKSGAVREGIEEKDIDLAIVLQIKKIFDARTDSKIGVYYTRLSDRDVPLEKRVGLANALKADLFISIHNNTTASASAAAILHGTQVLYHQADQSRHNSHDFARICLEEVSQTLNSNPIGLLEGDDIYIIRNSKSPVALIEAGFMTYPQELEKLVDEDYQKLAARGVEKAITRAFQEGY